MDLSSSIKMDSKQSREELLYRISALQDELLLYQDLDGKTDEELERVYQYLSYRKRRKADEGYRKEMMRKMMLMTAQVGESLASKKLLPLNLHREGKVSSITEDVHEALYPPPQVVPDSVLTEEQLRKKAYAKQVDRLINEFAEDTGVHDGPFSPQMKLFMGMIMNVMGKHMEHGKQENIT
jgi:hypothetical protein